MAESFKQMSDAPYPEFYGGRVLLPSQNRHESRPVAGRKRAKKAVSKLQRIVFTDSHRGNGADDLGVVYELPCAK